MATFFDSIAESRIQNPIKSLWWSFSAKKYNNFQVLTFFGKKPQRKCQTVLPVKKKETILILFYILLHNFTWFYKLSSCLWTLNFALKSSNRVNINRRLFLCIVPCVCLAFLCWIKFVSGCFRQAFFHLGDKKNGRWSR